MRVMVIVKATKNSEANVMPDEKLMTEMGKYNEELMKAGVLLAGDGLHPSTSGKRIRFADGKKSVIDGPFAETKELIAGYWMWQVKSMDEAVEWARRCPPPCPARSRSWRFAPSSRQRTSAPSSLRSCARGKRSCARSWSRSRRRESERGELSGVRCLPASSGRQSQVLTPAECSHRSEHTPGG